MQQRLGAGARVAVAIAFGFRDSRASLRSSLRGALRASRAAMRASARAALSSSRAAVASSRWARSYERMFFRDQSKGKRGSVRKVRRAGVARAPRTTSDDTAPYCRTRQGQCALCRSRALAACDAEPNIITRGASRIARFGRLLQRPVSAYRTAVLFQGSTDESPPALRKMHRASIASKPTSTSCTARCSASCGERDDEVPVRKDAAEMCIVKHDLAVPRKGGTTADYVPSSAKIEDAIAARRAMKALFRHGDVGRLDPDEKKSPSAFSFGSNGFILAPQIRLIRCSHAS